MKLPMPFPNPATYRGHSGVDYAQPRGAVIRASGPGRVVSRGRNDRGGFYIWVQYDNGPTVGYHHMDSHDGCPALGARVGEGDRLGYVGNTGNSTGPHLHSEVSGHATTDGYWKFFDRNRVVGSGSAAGGSSGGDATESEDDMFTDDDRKKINSVFDAIFSGGNSMKDGKKSISQSLAEIQEKVGPIFRGGKAVSLRQEVADIKTTVYAQNAALLGMEAALKALAASKGVIDPDVIVKAAQDGVERGLRNATFTASIDG